MKKTAIFKIDEDDEDDDYMFGGNAKAKQSMFKAPPTQNKMKAFLDDNEDDDEDLFIPKVKQASVLQSAVSTQPPS